MIISKTIKNTYKNFFMTLKNTFKSPLKIDNLGGKWHTLNHNIILIKYKKIVRFNPKLNLLYLKSILAFLITMYEFDSFSKILVAVGIPQHSEISQIRLYSNVSQYYIIRWLPGMLTSRLIMSRDFVRTTLAKSSIVRYNLKYMRSTVLKLYNIPDLLILSSLDGVGSIIAKEAVLMRVPTIGLMTTKSFPANIGFRFFGDTSDLLFIKSFLAILGLGMRVGNSLNLYNNPLMCKSLINEHFTVSKFDPDKINFKDYLVGYHDDFIVHKQYSINTSFVSLKTSLFFYLNIKKNKFKLYYLNLNLNLNNKLKNKKKNITNIFFDTFLKKKNKNIKKKK